MPHGESSPVQIEVLGRERHGVIKLGAQLGVQRPGGHQFAKIKNLCPGPGLKIAVEKFRKGRFPILGIHGRLQKVRQHAKGLFRIAPFKQALRQGIAHTRVYSPVALAHQGKAIPQNENAPIVFFSHGIGKFFLKSKPDNIAGLRHVGVFWVAVNKICGLAHGLGITLAPIEPHGLLEPRKYRLRRSAGGRRKVGVNLGQITTGGSGKNLGHGLIIDGRIINAALGQPQICHICRMSSRKMPRQIGIQKFGPALVAKAGIHVAHFKEQVVIALLPGHKVVIQPVQGQGRNGFVQSLIIGALQKQECGVFNIIAGPALAYKVENNLRIGVLALVVQRLGKPHGRLLQKGGFRVFVEHDGKGLLRLCIHVSLELRLAQGRKTLRHAGIIRIAPIHGHNVAPGVYQIAHVDVDQPQTQEGLRHAGRTQVKIHGFTGG